METDILITYPMWLPGTDLDNYDDDAVETETDELGSIFQFVDGSTITVFEWTDPEVFELEPGSYASEAKKVIEDYAYDYETTVKYLNECYFTEPIKQYCTLYADHSLCRYKRSCSGCGFKTNLP